MSLRKCLVIQSILLVTFLLFAACGTQDDLKTNSNTPERRSSKSQNSPAIDETNIAKIRVFVDEKIQLNDKEVNIEELKKALAALKEVNGSVWYYRENPTEEPPPHAISVIDAIIELELPISMSAKPDFSDAVVPEGRQKR